MILDLSDLNSEVTIIKVRFINIAIQYSRTSILRSPMILDLSDLNSEVTVLAGLLSYILLLWNNFGLSLGDHNSEVAVLLG